MRSDFFEEIKKSREKFYNETMNTGKDNHEGTTNVHDSKVNSYEEHTPDERDSDSGAGPLRAIKEFAVRVSGQYFNGEV